MRPPTPGGGSRGPGLAWLLAGGLYLVAYSAALGLSAGAGLATSALAGLVNALPDLLAAPLVLRAVERLAARGRRPGPGLAAVGLAFVGWSVAATSLGVWAVRTVRDGAAEPWPDPRIAVWKALLSLLVFLALAGAALARARAAEARQASLRALEAEALSAEARLAVLRAQLNPHFILNVLHSLVGLAERDPPATAAALERLGATLRYAQGVQRRGQDRVALGEELDFTREYLELERLRLGDRLRTRLEVAEALRARVVPPFLLQPLVENAVRHAVAPRAGGGTVAVRVDEEDGALRLQVEDDGAGGTEAATAGSGLGLALLTDRLEALYRGRGSLRLDRSPLGGLRATVRLQGEPWEPAP